METSRDRVLRAMTDDGAFRVIALRATDLVRDAAEAHGLSGSSAALFGELLTGAVLVRETMAPMFRVQVSVTTPGGVKMMADSHPDGMTRGLATVPHPGRPVTFGEGALLKVVRVLPRAKLHESIVGIPEADGISGALMVYLQESEQITSVLSVACVDDGSGIVAAGGYIVQVLPNTPEELLAVMTLRLDNDFQAIGPLLAQSDANPDVLVSELLYRMPYTMLNDADIAWGCNCSELRVVSALSTLGRAELEELVTSGEVLEIDCDYCGTHYQIGPQQLRSLLDSN